MDSKIVSILEKYEQKHILDYLSILSEEEKEKLEEQLLSIDFDLLKELYQQTKRDVYIDKTKIEHIPYVDKQKLSEKEKNKLEQIGEEIIKSGKVAVVTLAGGQGTRLGHTGPKGTYAVSTIFGQKYLFEVIIDLLKKASNKYNVTIPWFVMTSEENHNETVSFLEEKNFFGYNKDKVKFFTQGQLPLINTEGKLILDKDKKIKEAADGNGGVYVAFAKSGYLKELKQKGTQWIFVSNIDNILSNFLDPILLGVTVSENNKIASKSVAKTNPKEKVGVFCKSNGKPKIIEYIDLPEEMAEERDENGELNFGEVNIVNHLFNLSVMDDLANVKLPYHAAFKKSGYLNTTGEFVEVSEPNVYKFESFIFDAFERYDDMSLLRVKREEEFAPIKNRTGNDSPETATKLYNEKFANE